jgi:dTMP kinase
MEKNKYPGKFIVMEGLDGSGLSTQARLLRNFLSKKGRKTVLTKEPTMISLAGREIRKVLDRKLKIPAKKLQELFAKDREEHLKKEILPALKKGKIVISDRYFFSSFAFGKAQGLPLGWLIKLNDKFLLPDLTLILQVRPRICLQRIQKRKSEKTLFEKGKGLSRAYREYKTLPARFKDVKLINGEKTINGVFLEIKKTLLKAGIL